jgi:hypothetical protein
MASTETLAPSRSHASTRDRRKRGPIPRRRKKCSPGRNAPLLIMFRTRFGLTFSSDADAAREGEAKSVAVSYNAPEFLAERHHIEGALRAPFDAVESIVEEVVGP